MVKIVSINDEPKLECELKPFIPMDVDLVRSFSGIDDHVIHKEFLF